MNECRLGPEFGRECAHGSPRRRLPATARHGPGSPRASGRAGGASTWAPAGATSRSPWPRSSGTTGRVYAVDSDPLARDEAARAAAAHSQVLAITQAGEDLVLPEPVDLAFCRFLLLHVRDPCRGRPAHGRGREAGGWVVAQEPITSAGRIGGVALSMPDARHPDVGALCRRWSATPGSRSSTPGPRRRPASGPARWPATWPR